MTVWGPQVLITSAGRRVGLVRAFQEAKPDTGATVHACDLNPRQSAACEAADHVFAVPRCDDPDYIEALFAYCHSCLLYTSDAADE